ALTLAEFASKVIVLQREAALTSQAYYRDRVTAHPKIELRFGTVVQEILGEATVTGLRTRDASREDIASDVEAAAVFAYIGLQPTTAVLKGRVKLDSAGAIPTDGWMRTDLIGVCAVGNARSQSSHRAASAAGDGASAAVAVDRYLADGSWRGGG